MESVRLAPAGDVNGDGLGDVLVGVPRADPLGRRDAGSAFVVFGRRDRARVDLDSLGTAGIHIAGRPPAVPVELDPRGVTGEAAGRSVSALGDIDGDGFDDVAVGAPLASHGEDRLVSGVVHVVFGRREPGTIDLAEGGTRVEGPQAFDAFGDEVAGLTGALAIGAIGRVHVLPADALRRNAVIDLARPDAPGHRITGYDDGEFNPFYARSHDPRRLTTSPDLDGDGRTELLIGTGDDDVEGVEPDESPYESSAFAVFGGAPADLGRLGRRGIRVDGAGSTTETPLIGPGDVGGGRRPDLLVADVLRSRFGGQDPRQCVLLDPRPGRLSAARARRRCLPGLGKIQVAGLGDVDGDGRGEIVRVTEQEFEGPRTPERLQVFSVHRRVRRLAELGSGGRRLGAALAGTGDVDGDGRADVALTAGREIVVVTARSLRRR